MTKDITHISIRGARVNNLKNVDIDIPLKKITCFVGPSGSGKSSLAFHTLLAESKRRLMNCFPNDLKFFSEKPPAVDVDHLSPVLPVFGLPQINPIKGARTNVLDSIGLTHLLQNLWYYMSEEYCDKHHVPLETLSYSKQFKEQIKYDESSITYFLLHKVQYLKVFSNQILPSRVYDPETEAMVPFDKEKEYWEICRCRKGNFDKLDEILSGVEGRISSLYIHESKGIKLQEWNPSLLKQCPICFSPSKVTKSENLFSPHNALGACSSCNGFGANLVIDEDKLMDKSLSINEGGVKILKHKKFSNLSSKFKTACKSKKISFNKPISQLGPKFKELFYKGSGQWSGFDKMEAYMERKKYKPGMRILLRRIQTERLCDECDGSRINKLAKRFYIDKSLSNLPDITKLTIGELSLEVSKIKTTNKSIKFVLDKIKRTLDTAKEIGLDHLNLNRKTKTISAGEYQRILLIKYLSFDGTDSLFVFDEPSIGLDKKQQRSLFKGLERIKAQGNTVVLVDHSPELAKKSDKVIWMGPEAGSEGGEIIKEGKFQEKRIKHNFTKVKRKLNPNDLQISELEVYGKKYNKFKFPLKSLIWVHGETGTGKSSVFNVVLNELNYKLKGEYLFDRIGKVKKIAAKEGMLESVLIVDANLNRYTSRSTVGSFTDLAKPMRRHYVQQPTSKALGLSEGHFSPNSELGRCPKCEGRGFEVIEMQYLEDVILPCEECKGQKLKEEYASLTDGILTVSESYQLPIAQVFENISLTPKYKRILSYLKKLKLDYLSLSRNMTNLSGGEKQRIYLLSKLLVDSKNQLILIENLSFGLSERELFAILEFLNELSTMGKTIVLIDHNPKFKEFCDWEVHFEHGGKITSKKITD